VLQEGTQLVPLQVTVPLPGALQAAQVFPHELRSVLPFTMQVLPHWWKPELQETTQLVPLQATVPLVGSVQTTQLTPHELTPFTSQVMPSQEW
jgi:hypothetical protein